MKNKILLSLLVILTFLVGIVLGYYMFNVGCECIINCSSTEKEKAKIDNVEVKEHDGKDYYIIKDKYSGDYDYQNISLSEYYSDYKVGREKVKLFNTQDVISYSEYYEFCEKWNLETKYSDVTKNYIVIAYASYGQPIVEAKLANVVIKDGVATTYLWENTGGVTADITGYFLVIPVDYDVYRNDIQLLYTEEEFNNIVKYGTKYDPGMISVDKPLIYIYPKEDIDVEVKLSNPNKLTVSYPKYIDKWEVRALKDGTLIDKTGRKYYGLYWEGIDNNNKEYDDGFIVKGSEVTKFLEEKLSILGLSEKEANEFIIYWLPKLEKNNYNFIRFESMEEINSYMELDITPKPDTLIRVLMDFKPLDRPIKVREQQLTKVERVGYTVVEWGGRELK